MTEEFDYDTEYIKNVQHMAERCEIMAKELNNKKIEVAYLKHAFDLQHKILDDYIKNSRYSVT